MKMVLAMIEPQRLKQVRQSLSAVGIYNLTVSTALGCSTNTAPVKERYRGMEHELYLFRKTRLEIVVNDDQVDAVVDAIAAAARMEIERNHGMIFVYEILQAVKVTGERGPEIVQARGA
jgi:nitrogen regulatory protein PII